MGSDKDTIRFAAVGDITLGDHPLCVGFGARSHFKSREPGYPLSAVRDLFDTYDVIFANLECAHSEKNMEAHSYHSIQMRGEPRMIPALADAGISAVNVANNHSLQHGEEPFNDTMALLNEHNIAACGVNNGDHHYAKPVILDRNGVKLGILAYSLRPRQYFDRTPLYAEGEPAIIKEQVRDLKKETDLVILSLHWGEEFIKEPSPDEISLAHEMIDTGVSLIIGHHPHVLRGVERYKEGLIVYSLGNFICDMLWDESLRETMIFECNIKDHRITSFELIPAFINKNYQPVIINSSTGDEVRERILNLGEFQPGSQKEDLQERRQSYQNEADRILGDIRRKSQRYFLRNIYRYSLRVSIQQIATYLRNRIKERSE